MSQELVLIASIVLGVVLIPSLITVRPRYIQEDDSDLASPGLASTGLASSTLASSSLGSQPTE